MAEGSMNITIDIETVPGQAPGLLAEYVASVTAPAQYKKADSIAEWLRENRDAEGEAAWLKTSFDGGVGQIVCIGWAIDDEEPESVHVCDLSAEQERGRMEAFFRIMHTASSTRGTRPVLIGHNHAAFDLPFIWKRAVVHGIKPPLWWPKSPKPWADSIFDTMVEWAGAKDRISMDKLCKVLGIPGKGGMDGSQVWPMVQAGRIGDVASYCRDDVARTRAMWRRMTFAAGAPVIEPATKPAPDRMDAPWALPGAPINTAPALAPAAF
jgi:3'-5' exonuclease